MPPAIDLALSGKGGLNLALLIVIRKRPFKLRADLGVMLKEEPQQLEISSLTS